MESIFFNQITRAKAILAYAILCKVSLRVTFSFGKILLKIMKFLAF